MTKQLKATKCKDGWVVEIITRHAVGSEGEVQDTVRYEGLEIKEHHQPTKDNPNEFIYAD